MSSADAMLASRLVTVGFNRRFTSKEADDADLYFNTLNTLLEEGVVGVCVVDLNLYITRKGWEFIENAYGITGV